MHDHRNPPPFPKGFIFGTATAAYQIEGAAAEDGRGPSIWDTFAHIPGNVKNNETGDVACDHYHRLEEDLDLIAGVAPHYRFSVSWTRIFPTGTGEINQQGVDFYNRLIDGLIARGVTPWLTLYHWDLPQALQDKGGWANRDIVQWFDHYAATCVRLFGDRVKNWMIINEPSVISYLGHALGIFAPGIKDERQYWACVHHLNMVVGTTFRTIKAIDPMLRVGSTYTPVPCRMVDAQDDAMVELLECAWHYNFLHPLFTGTYPDKVADYVAPFVQHGDAEIMKAELDFCGLQHYSPIYFEPDSGNILGARFGQGPDSLPKNDIGWVIDPAAFQDILEALNTRYPGKVWIVTENGIALEESLSDGTLEDNRRIDYLQQYMKAVQGAMASGMKISGYFVWSLMDNYEWASGYGPRFGLIFIDYAGNQDRTTKKSYVWYRNFVADQA